EADAGPIPFEGNATLVLRAVANLVDNAAKHAGGVEQLCVRTTASKVTFVVEDRDCGLDDNEETRIFEPFARERAGGGLGLALVRRIAEAHEGRVFAENREGGGARFGIELSRSRTRAASGPPGREGTAPYTRADMRWSA